MCQSNVHTSESSSFLSGMLFKEVKLCRRTGNTKPFHKVPSNKAYRRGAR